MVDFLSMLNIEYGNDKEAVDDFITELIDERDNYKEWSNSKYESIVDIRRRYTDDISVLVRSVLKEGQTLDVRLFIVCSDAGQFNRSENVKISYNENNIIAIAYTKAESEGAELNFILENVEDYETAIMYDAKVAGVYLSGFCAEGMVVFPIDEEVEASYEVGANFGAPLEAYESMPEEDLSDLTAIRELLKTEDVLSVLEVYFFPIKDLDTMYSVLGFILAIDKAWIRGSRGFLYKLKVRTMGIEIDVFINEKDLLGVPSVGMRFKGNVWLHGKIAFV